MQAAGAGKRASGSGPRTEPDRKTALANLVSALKPCGDALPAVAKDALHAAEGLLGGGADVEAACAASNLSLRPAAR